MEYLTCLSVAESDQCGDVGDGGAEPDGGAGAVPLSPAAFQLHQDHLLQHYSKAGQGKTRQRRFFFQKLTLFL